jgi:fatty-acyl-CoA synthase
LEQTAASSVVDTLFPWLAWTAIVLLVSWWAIRRWEARLAAKQSFKLKFPLSPMVFLSRRLVIESLVQDEEVQAAMQRRAGETGQSLASVERGVRRQAYELVPAFKAVFYFSIGYWLARMLLLTLYRVRLVRDSRDEYAKIGRDATVVLVMNHRSNVDVLLVNFLLARHSAVAHAAGEWARLWPLHHLVRLAGNYVVDRDSNDALYRLVLKRYVQMAVTHGVHLAIFPEGSLTRDGRLRPLSFGLLNYAATASWPGLDRDVVFLPVGFSYDRIPEQQGLVFDDSREFSERGKLYTLFASLRFVFRFLRLPFTRREDRFGWASASFGHPVSLRRWQRARGIDLQKLSAEKRRNHVDALGRQLIGDVMDNIPVRPIHLVAAALADDPQRRWAREALSERVAELKAATDVAGAPFWDGDVDDATNLEEALHLLVHIGAVHVSAGEVAIADGQLPMLQYYANSIAHYLEPGQPDTDEQAADVGQDSRKFLATVYESFDRVQDRSIDGQGFFERFYDAFTGSSPEVAKRFSGTDMVAQQAHLRASLKHVVDYAISGKPGLEMRRIARSHSKAGMGIPSDLYDVWLDSLLAVLAQFDPEFDTQVELSWRSVMAPGIGYMRSRYDAAGQPVHAGSAVGSVADEGIVRWIDHWAARAPDRLALRSARRSLTYHELVDESGRLAAGLHSRLGVDVGDRVGFLGHNCIEFLAVLFACARLGAILVPINFRLAESERARLVARTEAKVLFVDARHRMQALDESSRCVRVLLEEGEAEGGELTYADLQHVPGPMLASRGRFDSPLLMVFTSGSTGDPKGAILTQSALHWNALNSRVMHDMTRSDHVLTNLPFFHVGGINIQTLPALQVGASVTVSSGFDAADFVEVVERERPTLTVLVPTQMQLLMKLPNWQACDLSSLRSVSTGSTIVSQELIAAWADKGVPVVQVYGCTESGPIAAHQTVEGIRPGWGTVGHAALYTDVMVADSDGRPMATGAEGEILLRGMNLASHYWRDPEATDKAFANGWFHTGDLGYFDENGRLTIVGRKKRLIISGGENVHPAEVEHVLELHPGVKEATVVGVADPAWGEVPAALVVAGDDATDEAVLREHLVQHLGRYKHPRHIFFTDSLPRTGLDKIAYPEVSALVEARLRSLP